MASSKKPWYQKWWAIALFILIGLGVIGNLMPTDTEKEENTTENTNYIQETKKESGKDDSLSEKLDKCTRLCAGEEYEIPYVKDEVYKNCYQIYYYAGMQALDDRIAECSDLRQGIKQNE